MRQSKHYKILFENLSYEHFEKRSGGKFTDIEKSERA